MMQTQHSSECYIVAKNSLEHYATAICNLAYWSLYNHDLEEEELEYMNELPYSVAARERRAAGG